MIKGFSIIFILLFLGDSIRNVIGMIFMTVALKYKIVKLEDIKPVSDVLVNNLAFFYGF